MARVTAIQEYLRGAYHLPGRCLSIGDLRGIATTLNSTIHLAVMIEPYLSKVCSGEKYIESRLTKVNVSPFGRASTGDIVLLKLSGGPIAAAATIEHVLFKHLKVRDETYGLAERYSEGLAYEPGYVETKSDASFASLLWLQDVVEVPPVKVQKRGRQAWVTVNPICEPQFSLLGAR